MKVPARPRAASTAVIVGLSLALLLPSLGIGFLLDDYLFLSAIEGRLFGRDADESLFSILRGDPGQAAELAKDGFLPWWSQEDVKFVFFRPTSEMLMRADYALFGRRPFGWHLHSLLWWIATLLAAGLLLRRSVPGAFGTVAFLLFAIDESHLLPAGWISNRNALVALAPAFLGVWAHVRWREDGWRPGRALSVAGFLLGLTGGEIALGALGYVVAFEWVCVRDWRSRLRGLAPAALLGAAYVAFHRLAGYGTAGSGIYLDPMADPVGFLVEAPARALALVCGGVVGLQADAWLMGPGWRRALTVLGALGIGIAVLMFRACARRVDPATRRALAWLTAGAALAVGPSLMTFPSDRLLLASAPGAAALIGTTLVLGWRAFRARHSRGLVVGTAALGVSHLLLGPVGFVATELLLMVQTRTTLAIARNSALAEARGTHVVLPVAPDYVIGNYLPLVMDHVAPLEIRGWRILSLARSDHRMTRSDARTLVLEVVDGRMMKTLFEKLYRREPLPAGTVLDRGAMTVEILEASGGDPTRVAFRFDRDLEDPSLTFLEWDGAALRNASPPTIGQTRLLPRRLGPTGF